MSPKTGPLNSPPARPQGRGMIVNHAPKFNYLQLNTEQSGQLYQMTQTVKRNLRQSLAAAIEAGKELRNVKKLLPHGDFGTWLTNEFSLSERSAQNLMSLADYVDQNPQVDLLALPVTLTGAYELAAPRTPPEVAAQVIAAAQTDGTPITRDAVKSARDAWGNRVYTTLSGIEISSYVDTYKTKHWRGTLAAPDGFNSRHAESHPSRALAARSVIDQYRVWCAAQADDQTLRRGTGVLLSREHHGLGVIGLIRGRRGADFLVETWSRPGEHHGIQVVDPAHLSYATDDDYKRIWTYAHCQTRDEAIFIRWQNHNLLIDPAPFSFSALRGFNFKMPDDQKSIGIARRLSEDFVSHYMAQGHTVHLFQLDDLDARMRRIVEKAGRTRKGEILYPAEDAPAPDANDDDLPDEPVSDLILTALGNRELSLSEILAAVRKVNPDVKAASIGPALDNLVEDGTLLRRKSPGNKAKYRLNGHSEASGQRTTSLADDKDAILDTLDRRRRDVFYLNELSRWSGINDQPRTRAAIEALPDVLTETTDRNGNKQYRRVTPLNTPVFVDASLPDADDLYQFVNAHDNAVPMSEVVEHFNLTPADLGEILNVIRDSDRLTTDQTHLYTNRHDNFYRDPVPAADGTPPTPVEVPGAQAIMDSLDDLKTNHAVQTLNNLESLLYAVETAIAAVETANLSALRFATDNQAATLNRRIRVYTNHLDTHRTRIKRLGERFEQDHAIKSTVETVYQDTHADLEAQTRAQ